MRALALALLLPTLALAQAPTPRPEDLGTIAGHIMCADTQRPARLAEVRLIQVSNPLPYPAEYRHPSLNSFTTGLAVHTDLTGGYTITGAQPGQYYLSVVLPGYVTPVAQFTMKDLKSPTPQIQQQIQHDVQIVTVTPNATVRADTTLERGASISGTVTFDDGSPAIGAGIDLLERDASGKLQLVKDDSIFTDSRGQYRIEALSPGEYVVDARLAYFTQANGTFKSIPDEAVTSFLTIYSGNVFRQKNASAIKVDAVQEAETDLSIPLSRLHDVSGTILAKDGHSISSGARIDLLDPDTHEVIARTFARGEGYFQIQHVPEGIYTLRVAGAMDWSAIEVPNPPGSSPRTHTEYRTLRTYRNLEQPLTVQTDIQSLILTVPDQPSTTAPK